MCKLYPLKLRDCVLLASLCCAPIRTFAADRYPPSDVNATRSDIVLLPSVDNDRPSASQNIEQVSTFSLQQLSSSPSRTVETVPTPPAALPNTVATPVPGLTLDDLQAMALANNPTLAQASANVQSFEGQWWQSGRYPNPRLSYRGDEIGDEGRSGFQGFSVIQEVVTSHKLALAQDIVSKQVQQAQADYAAQEFRVRNDVKLRFFDVLLAERSLELNQALEQNSQTAVRAATDLFQAAQVGRADVLQAQVEGELIQLQSIKARNAFQAAWRRLAAVVGIPEMAPRELIGDLHQDLTNVTWEEVWVRIASSSPEIAAAEAKVAAARCAVQKALADRCPNWEVEGGYAHDNATSFDTGLVSVTVPVPLFNRNQGAIHQAQAQLNAAQAEVARVTLDLRDRLAVAFERYSNARELVNRYEQSILPNAKESLDLNASRYRTGDINISALLIAQRTSLQTQVAYLDAIREYRDNYVLLDGFLLVDSLSMAGK
jgi:outer membrane protein, heavy metal efflux system